MHEVAQEVPWMNQSHIYDDIEERKEAMGFGKLIVAQSQG